MNFFNKLALSEHQRAIINTIELDGVYYAQTLADAEQVRALVSKRIIRKSERQLAGAFPAYVKGERYE